MITRNNLPISFIAYEKLTICSNSLINGGFLLSVGDTLPLIIGKGFISMGKSKKGSETARLLMLDAIRVIRISACFGGPKFMPEEKVDFINTWEVEKYRARLSDKR